MSSIFDAPHNKSWQRAQKFQLTEKGLLAEADYTAAIMAARAQPGRDSFDSARRQWAQTFAVEPEDGLYLGELKQAPRSISQMAEALEECGTTKQQAKDAVDRLAQADLISPTAI